MADGNTLWQIFNPATGVWALVAMAAVTLFKVWPFILERLNERHRDTAAERAGDWTRLRDEIVRLDARCDKLQREVDECHEREEQWAQRTRAAEERAMIADATLLGLGEGRNIATAQAIAEREAMKPKDKP